MERTGKELGSLSPSRWAPGGPRKGSRVAARVNTCARLLGAPRGSEQRRAHCLPRSSSNTDTGVSCEDRLLTSERKSLETDRHVCTSWFMPTVADTAEHWAVAGFSPINGLSP